MAEVEANGIRMHVQVVGDGSPKVLFLHGLVMDNLSSWYFTAGTRVAQEGACSVLVDLRGHGRSERPASGYGVDTLLADLVGALDALGVTEPVAVVGNSFGGQLAAAMAVAHPSRVGALALLDAHLGRAGWGQAMADTLSLEGEEADATIAKHFQDWLGRHSARKRNRLAETAKALVHDTSLVADLQASPPIPDDAIAALDMPILAMYGSESDLADEAARLARLCPAADVRVFDGASHSLMWERTAEVVDALVGWVHTLREGA